MDTVILQIYTGQPVLERVSGQRTEKKNIALDEYVHNLATAFYHIKSNLKLTE